LTSKDTAGSGAASEEGLGGAGAGGSFGAEVAGGAGGSFGAEVAGGAGGSFGAEVAVGGVGEEGVGL